MKLFRAYQKEIHELQFSLLLGILLIGYTISIFTVDSLRRFLDPALQNSMMTTALYCLVIWLALTILVAYLRYARVSMDTRELHSMLEGVSNDVVLVVSPDRKIMMCNDSVEKVFGYTPGELMKQETSLLYKDRRPADGATLGISEQIERLGYHYGLAVGIRKDQSEFPLEIITGNLRGRKGAVLQIREAGQQHSASQKNSADAELVEELEISLKRLKDLEDSREALAQMIIHDMKTPLQVVIGNLEILNEHAAQKTESDVACAANALTQSRRLVDMIDSILQVSRLESGAIQLHRQPVNLKELIVTCADEAKPTLGNKSIELNLTEDDLVILADMEILRRVIQNLISNAVKHGGNDVDIRISADDHHGFARFSITDNGPGILPEHRDQIFEKYMRFQTIEGKGQISTGLGLTFCKLAIESHQGNISLESKPGEGCTVSFNIPLVSRLVSAG